MFKGKKIILCLMLIVMILGITACGGNETSDTVLIRLGHNMQPGTSVDVAALKFKELVEERSDGRIEVEVYGASQLGSMREQTEAVQFGSTEMTIQPISVLSPFVEDLQIFDYPYLWPDEETIWRVVDGDAGQKMLDVMEESGFKGFGFWAAGFKAMTANKPIKSPADLVGLKIRVMPSPLLVAEFESWGANAVPIDLSELYNSLQQGVVDGEENPFWIIYAQKYHEVQKHMTVTQHGYLGYISTMNKAFYEKLDPELQEIVIDAERDARLLGREIASADEEKYLNLLAEHMEVYVLNEEEKAEFKAMSDIIFDDFTKTDRQKEILNMILSDIANN